MTRCRGFLNRISCGRNENEVESYQRNGAVPENDPPSRYRKKGEDDDLMKKLIGAGEIKAVPKDPFSIPALEAFEQPVGQGGN